MPSTPSVRRLDRHYIAMQVGFWAVFAAACIYQSYLLTERGFSDAQSGLSDDAARRANVLGAYAAVDPELVEGRRVLLIDDVITTGATISECARILRTVGAKEVVCATLARARG